MTLTRQITVGPPLAYAPRRRPVGRVGGVIQRAADASALACALGPGAQVLVAGSTDLVVDWDSCWLNGEPIEHLDGWRTLLAAGLLAEVEGAFALGWRTPDGTLTLARDAPGERTLFYAPLPDGDETVARLGDPNGDPLTVPNALLFREAASEVGVVLSGEGGDPCFGGPKNLPMLLAELYDQGDGVRERSYLRAHLKCYDDLGHMLTPAVRDALVQAPLETQLSPWLHDARWPHFVSRLQALNVAFKGAHHILPRWMP